MATWETVGVPAAHVAGVERAAFIRRTYGHLAAAILAFVGLEAFLFSSGLAGAILQALPNGRLGWMLVLAAFMGASWLAQRWAEDRTSVAMQYAGLGLYVVAEAFIFVPLLGFAALYAGPDTIPAAGIYTALIFTGLTGTAFITRKDFSFLAPALGIAGMAAMGVIITSMLFGFSLGNLFCALMVAFAAGYILFHTSKVLHHYPTDAHVAASLSLFASVALLFWYVLRLTSSRR